MKGVSRDSNRLLGKKQHHCTLSLNKDMQASSNASSSRLVLNQQNLVVEGSQDYPCSEQKEKLQRKYSNSSSRRRRNSNGSEGHKNRSSVLRQ